MMKKAMALEKAMPMYVSHRMRRSSERAPFGKFLRGRAPGCAPISSTSSEHCQKKRYGLMVVPNIATTIIAASALRCSFGRIARWKASSQGALTMKATAT